MRGSAIARAPLSLPSASPAGEMCHARNNEYAGWRLHGVYGNSGKATPVSGKRPHHDRHKSKLLLRRWRGISRQLPIRKSVGTLYTFQNFSKGNGSIT